MNIQFDNECIKFISALLKYPSVSRHESVFSNAIEKLFTGFTDINCYRDVNDNLFVDYRAKDAPFALQAHMDHPGYAVSAIKNNYALLMCLGKKLPKDIVGQPLDFFNMNGKQLDSKKILDGSTYERILVDKQGLDTRCYAMWKLPVFHVGEEEISGRAFDDCLGSAIIAYCGKKMYADKIPFKMMFTVDEEEGKIGAQGLLNRGIVPSSILSVEMTKKENEHGVICRCARTSRILEKIKNVDTEERIFHTEFPRKNSEAELFMEYARDSVELCIAVNNKHNRHDRSQKPVCEVARKDDIVYMMCLLNNILKG